MKYAIIFLSFFLLSACSTTQEVGLTEKECGIGELMAGISCVEANYNKIEKEPLGAQGILCALMVPEDNDNIFLG